MTKIIGLVVLAASMSSSAMAFDFDFSRGGDKGDGGHGRGSYPAPEIDPASALSAMTMLGAGVMILRGRRSKK